MAAVSNSIPQAPLESKSAKKKKTKADVIAKEPHVQSEGETGNGQGLNEAVSNGADGAYESPYLKELYKYATSQDHNDKNALCSTANLASA